MTEPASASTATVLAGVGLTSLLPFIDGDCLIGAVLGASVVALHTKNVVWYLKIVSLLLSIMCGYSFAYDAQAVMNIVIGRFGFSITSIAVVSCLVSVVSVPFIKKLSDWAYQFDLAGLIDTAVDKVFNRKSKDKEGD